MFTKIKLRDGSYAMVNFHCVAAMKIVKDDYGKDVILLQTSGGNIYAAMDCPVVYSKMSKK